MKKVQLLVLSLVTLLFSCETQAKVETVEKTIDINKVAASSHKLENTKDLDVVLNEIGNSKYVLLGEASHGTKEYYTWRAEITKRLVKEKGFNVIAVEGDWPDLYQLNQYAKNTGNKAGSAREIMRGFDRWPTWMWANEEVADLTEWLRTHNAGQASGNKTGFYGMDVYSLWSSLNVLEKYLATADQTAFQKVKDVKACLAPYWNDENAYGQAATYGSAGCSADLKELLKAVQNHLKTLPEVSEEAFSAEQNALAAVNAEKYYCEMYRSNAGSWNLRDRHMVETVNRLVKQQGPNAKVIIWAHNTHVGDARATDMRQDGMVNVGQLIRQQHENEGVYVIGFGSYEGSVIAANRWEGQMQTMKVPQAPASSWEGLLHKIDPKDKMVLLRNLKGEKGLNKAIGHRAIGVVYNPANEDANYVSSIMPERYDAFIFIDETTALTPVSTVKATERALVKP